MKVGGGRRELEEVVEERRGMNVSGKKTEYMCMKRGYGQLERVELSQICD